jgi:hypothetical protein
MYFKVYIKHVNIISNYKIISIFKMANVDPGVVVVPSDPPKMFTPLKIGTTIVPTGIFVFVIFLAILVYVIILWRRGGGIPTPKGELNIVYGPYPRENGASNIVIVESLTGSTAYVEVVGSTGPTGGIDHASYIPSGDIDAKFPVGKNIYAKYGYRLIEGVTTHLEVDATPLHKSKILWNKNIYLRIDADPDEESEYRGNMFTFRIPKQYGGGDLESNDYAFQLVANYYSDRQAKTLLHSEVPIAQVAAGSVDHLFLIESSDRTINKIFVV